MNQRTQALEAGERLRRQHGVDDPFAAAIRATRMAMIITDPTQENNPIIFANEAFARLTGYSTDSVIGQNCRFLQGPDTDPLEVDRMREAITNGHDIAVDLLNYRRDGTAFWNALYVSPVFDDGGNLVYFFGSQLDITAKKEAELQLKDTKAWLQAEVERQTSELQDALAQKTILLHEVDHRVKNNLQLVSSLILLHLRRINDPEVKSSLQVMLNRVVALSTIHRRLFQLDKLDLFDVTAFVRDLGDDLIGASGRTEIAMAYDLVPASLPAAQAAPIGLIINEVLTNALKHAFPGGRGGTISIVVQPTPDAVKIAVRDDGVGRAGSGKGGTFGTQMITLLARQVKATVTWENGEPGTSVRVEVPRGST